MDVVRKLNQVLPAAANAANFPYGKMVIREFKTRSLRTTDYGNTRRGPVSRFTTHARLHVGFVVGRVVARYGE